MVHNVDDKVFRGLIHQRQAKVQPSMIDDLRNFMFGNQVGGNDLALTMIMRGRDLGFPNFIECSVAYGGKNYTSFLDITGDQEIADILEEIYGDINEIDPIVGAFCEKHVEGKAMGRLFIQPFIEQFTRIRDGDRFWFEREGQFTEAYVVRSTNIQ